MMKEFRHLLFMETGGHNWKKVKSNFKFSDPSGVPYIVEKCKQCGITAKRYYAIGGDKKGRGDGFMDALLIGPQYPRKYAMECPEEMGLFDYVDPEKEETSTVLGEESPQKITRKKKKKKKSESNPMLAYSELYGDMKKGKKDKKKKKGGFKRIKKITHLKEPKKAKKFKITRKKKS